MSSFARPRPLAFYIASLTLALVLPALVAIAILVQYWATSEQTRLEVLTAQINAEAQERVDRFVTGQIATLQALATSPSLREGNLRDFQQQARDLFKLQGMFIALRDRAGKQLVNTRMNDGAPLPIAPLEIDERVFRTGQPATSDLFTGAVVAEPLVGIVVPVTQDGEVKYTLVSAFRPGVLNDLIASAGIAPPYSGAVTDRKGRIIARSVDIESAIGKPLPGGSEMLGLRGTWLGQSLRGVPIFRTYSRSPVSEWTIAVAIERTALEAPLAASMHLLLLMIAGLGLLAFVGSSFVARRMLSAQRTLAASARGLGNGDIVAPSVTFILEVNEVSAIVAIASTRLRDQADALSGRNRELVAQMRETTDLLHLAQRAAGAGTWEWDMRSDLMRHSPESACIHGLSARDEALAMTPAQWTALIHDQDATPTWNAIHQAVDTRATFSAEYRVPRKNNADIWVLVLGQVLFDTFDRPIRIVGLHLDVTERKGTELALTTAKQDAEAATAAKSEFLASMSHELRTPLNAIIGFSRLMVDERNPAMPLMQRYARLVQDASTTLLSIVNDVLDVSKLEGGNVDLDPHPFSPRDLVENVSTLLREQVEGKGLVLHVEADHSLPSALIGDDARLRQVLLNLLSNAIKFTAKGKIYIFVRCVSADAEIARVRFSVSDTGIGIAADKLHRLFKRFSQVDSSTARQFGGTGLGLSICKSLVEMMGGSIVVDSVEGEGTTFAFVLDLRIAQRIVTTPEQNLSDPAALTPHAAHILLAEDVELNQELAVAMLTRWGHTVEVVSDGAAAVDAVMRAAYDLVLMDIQMPVMDGIEATRRIRGLGGRFATLPIVAMTANVMSRDVALCREAGVDDHIGKPFAPEALRSLVERMTALRDTPTTAPANTDNEAAETVMDAVVLDELVALMGSAGVRSLLVRMETQLAGDPLSATSSATLGFAAHALISSSGMLGLSELSQACRTLERACTRDDDRTTALPIHLAAARAAIPRARACLTSCIDALIDAQAA